MVNKDNRWLYRGIDSEDERRNRDRWNIHPQGRINSTYYGRGFGRTIPMTYEDLGQDSLIESWQIDPYLPHPQLLGVESAAGPYAGVGPRGYQSSNDRIWDEVGRRMTGNGYLDASEIQVEVEAGEVILKGRVPNRRMKHLADEIAASVPGVYGVDNRLHVSH